MCICYISDIIVFHFFLVLHVHFSMFNKSSNHIHISEKHAVNLSCYLFSLICYSKCSSSDHLYHNVYMELQGNLFAKCMVILLQIFVSHLSQQTQNMDKMFCLLLSMCYTL